MTSTICTTNAFTKLLRNQSVKSLWNNSAKGRIYQSLSSSSFNGKHFSSRIINNTQRFGLRSTSLSMWGESPTQKKFTTFYDDDSENMQPRKPRQRRSDRENHNDANRLFRNSNKGDSGSGWDDFAADGDNFSDYEQYEYGQKSSETSGGNRRMNRRGGPSNKFRNDKRRDMDWDSSNSNERRRFKRKDSRGRKEINAEIAERKVNMRALEKAGFDHLYGIAPILNALAIDKRDFLLEEDASETGRKPEAQFTPYLFVQNTYSRDDSSNEIGGKKDNKVKAVREILSLVEKVGVPVEYVDKGVLNALSGNRPHQGLVLRCRPLDFTPLSKIPYPDNEDDKSSPRLWLALDEVVDPQNFGALLRSAYFLGSSSTSSQIGVLVCSKNSSPASPTVSAASAGALEIMDICSTNNLPRTLNSAVEDGWRVLGAAAEPLVLNSNRNNGDSERIIQCTDLTDLKFEKKQPTILVLGSEGHGLRTLVARACTEFVRIPSGSDMGFEMDEDSKMNKKNSAAGVDSLNVSVSAAILLWSMINGLLK